MPHKFYWYDYVTESIRQYGAGALDEYAKTSPECRKAKAAIDAVVEDLRINAQGDEFEDLHYRFVDAVLIRHSLKFTKALEELHVSHFMGQRWIVTFVYEVSKKMGFERDRT